MMKKFKGYFLNIIKDDEISDAFDIEVNNYHLTNNLLPVLQSDNTQKSLSMWWAKVFANHQYPNLFNLMKACLSIITVFQVWTLTIYNLFYMKQNLAGSKLNKVCIDSMMGMTESELLLY